MPPRRRRPSPRRSQSNGTVFACAAAGLALVLVMGVTVAKRGTERDVRPDRPVASAPRVTVPPEWAPASPKHVRKAAGPLDGIASALKDVSQRMPGIRRMSRGPDFENARVGALADLSTARETLGAHLDAHPGDDRGHRLWDRLQALYVALKKL